MAQRNAESNHHNRTHGTRSKRNVMWRTEETWVNRDTGEISYKRPEGAIFGLTISRKIHVDWETAQHVVHKLIEYSKKHENGQEQELRFA